MNLIVATLYAYITASVTAISSHNKEFHKLNLILYSSLIFFTLFFIPMAIYMHIFYQGYMFLYFLTDFINAIYPYRVYVTVIFVIFYYALFLLIYRIDRKNLQNGKRQAVITRIIFFTALVLFLEVVLFKRSLYIGTVHSYLSEKADLIFFKFSGYLPVVYPIVFFLFYRLVITRIRNAV